MTIDGYTISEILTRLDAQIKYLLYKCQNPPKNQRISVSSNNRADSNANSNADSNEDSNADTNAYVNASMNQDDIMTLLSKMSNRYDGRIDAISASLQNVQSLVEGHIPPPDFTAMINAIVSQQLAATTDNKRTSFKCLYVYVWMYLCT